MSRDVEISVIIRCRDEWPLVATTIHSYMEDLEHSKIPYEIIVATNQCTDFTPDILRDKYRRWIRKGTLKVVEFNDRPSHWETANKGIEASVGKYVVISDAHMSIKYGTMERLRDGCKINGGLWFGAEQQWNDTKNKTYQYDLKLFTSFWGHRCRFMSKSSKVEDRLQDGRLIRRVFLPYPIAMAPHCMLLASRKEINKFGSYSPPFATYGGGEPYLCMKWWMLGSSCWIDPQALCRHAFGYNATWTTARKDHRRKGSAYLRDGTFSKEIKKGQEHLSYSKSYTRGNREFFFNFALAAFTLGGIPWLNNYLSKAKIRPNVAEGVRQEVLRVGMPDREFIKTNLVRTLSELIQDPPWETCGKEGHGDGTQVPREI